MGPKRTSNQLLTSNSIFPQTPTLWQRSNPRGPGLLPASCSATRLLTASLLKELLADGVVVPEKSMRANAGEDARLGRIRRATPARFDILPESPLPKKLLSAKPTPTPTRADSATAGTEPYVRGFAIQIKPHHNGEIFLSRTAAAQNPGFFGWPFTGKTTPKTAGNPSYPQLEPDPIVNIVVFGQASEPILVLNSYVAKHSLLRKEE